MPCMVPPIGMTSRSMARAPPPGADHRRRPPLLGLNVAAELLDAPASGENLGGLRLAGGSVLAGVLIKHGIQRDSQRQRLGRDRRASPQTGAAALGVRLGAPAGGVAVRPQRTARGSIRAGGLIGCGGSNAAAGADRGADGGLHGP